MTFQELITNIIKNFETKLISLSLSELLQSFNLLEFENKLYKLVNELYEHLCKAMLINFLSSDFFKAQSDAYVGKKGGGKIKKRDTKLQIRTGTYIEIPNYYVENPLKTWAGPRHLFHHLFGTINKASPSYFSTVSMFSVICPSFEIASEMLNSQFVSTNYNRVRELSIKVGELSLSSRVGIQFKEGETLAGKIVFLSIDGGRGRMREDKEQLNKAGTHFLYNTPWREPKLFVIHIIDKETGKQSEIELPIYDCTFSDNNHFGLFSEYLKKLEIDKAEKVQFVADGAQWIWKGARPMLEQLGVKPENIIETLDYYHAVEHLSAMVKSLPKRIKKEQRTKLLIELKELLWEGKIQEIENKIKSVVKRTNKGIRREIKYFNKHKERCKYSFFKENKLLCGSGIVESAIRRVINLRFKCPSSFWRKENFESLVFLRATFLSKRWTYLITNLVKLEQKNCA